ncbi:MAG: hypothetical protein LBK72_10560 [Bifidobacteriaceae bacterium]|jgi:hypothetical protein|nr:hypothetical protein [Bifidobacteriaceae bacterium]
MSTAHETTIRVPVSLRDRIRIEAGKRRLRQSDLLALALRELDQAEFLRAVEAANWDADADAEAAAENRAWDDADLTGPLDPWDPEA